MEIFKKRNFSGSTLDFLHSGNEVFIYQVWAFSSLNIMNSNARDVAVKLYSTYTIASIVFLSQLGYLLSNFYQLHVLMRALRTYDIMILGGMNGKLASKNFFWKCILCTEGKNDEMGFQALAKDRNWTILAINSLLALLKLSTCLTLENMEKNLNLYDMSVCRTSKQKFAMWEISEKVQIMPYLLHQSFPKSSH